MGRQQGPGGAVGAAAPLQQLVARKCKRRQPRKRSGAAGARGAKCAALPLEQEGEPICGRRGTQQTGCAYALANAGPHSRALHRSSGRARRASALSNSKRRTTGTPRRRKVSCGWEVRRHCRRRGRRFGTPHPRPGAPPSRTVPRARSPKRRGQSPKGRKWQERGGLRRARCSRAQNRVRGQAHVTYVMGHRGPHGLGGAACSSFYPNVDAAPAPFS